MGHLNTLDIELSGIGIGWRRGIVGPWNTSWFELSGTCGRKGIMGLWSTLGIELSGTGEGDHGRSRAPWWLSYRVQVGGEGSCESRAPWGLSCRV